MIIGSTDAGLHNRWQRRTAERIKAGRAYKDLSTICVIPTRGTIPARVVESWWSLMSPMNNKFVRMFISGMEVGDAYQNAVQTIMGHPELSKWRFMLTLEEDNMPPPDGLLKLYESICDCPKVCNEHPVVVGGLYYTKGEGGQPMIYGNPKKVLSFEPQVPMLDKVQECNGLGMGFTLFRLDLFKDKRIEQPWFKTVQSYEHGVGVNQGTQDLYYFGKVRKAGYRVASDNRVKVGHIDEGGTVW